MSELPPGQLPEHRFSFRELKGGRVRVYSGGTPTTTLSGRDAVKFLARVEADPDGAPLLMAKVTGNYKRGNERSGRRR